MKFHVFKDGQQLTDLSLSGAYLFGADMIPLRHVDKIEFKNGTLECRKKTHDSAGLSLSASDTLSIAANLNPLVVPTR